MQKLLLIGFVLGCISCGGKLTSSKRMAKCPDSAYYYSKIEAIKNFQKDRTDTTLHFDRHSYDFSVDAAFIDAIGYLDSVTHLKSHVSLGYVFEYASTGDYEKDINQYTRWYNKNCSCTSN